MKKKHPSEEEKKKLDNEHVPSVTLRRAAREFKAGNYEEADRLWNLVKFDEKGRRRR